MEFSTELSSLQLMLPIPHLVFMPLTLANSDILQWAYFCFFSRTWKILCHFCNLTLGSCLNLTYISLLLTKDLLRKTWACVCLPRTKTLLGHEFTSVLNRSWLMQGWPLQHNLVWVYQKATVSKLRVLFRKFLK